MAGEDPSPLEAAFAAAAADKARADKFDMTPDEQQSFVKAMKDPEFRSLLNEYMLEISDPTHRAEQEAYLRQLENDNKVPTDKQLVLPTPGFVLKTKLQARKVFVNICSSDKIQPPSSTKVAPSPQVAAGTSWNLPYCVGPQRMEHDKGGQAVMTFDVCYHPQTLARGRDSAAFLKMLIGTALDGVDLALSKTNPNDGQVSRDYHILKGVSYKTGSPITMCISTPKTSSESATSSSAAKSNSPAAVPTAKAPPTTSVKAKPNTKPSSTKPTTAPSSTPTTKTKSATVVAKPAIVFQIVQRGQFDMADHMENGEKKLFRPRELVLKMDLPTHTSAAGIDLDVSATQVKVESKAYAPLCIDLPFPVVEAKGVAKFDKATKKLIVTLPVVPEAPRPTAPTRVESTSKDAPINDGSADAQTTETVQQDHVKATAAASPPATVPSVVATDVLAVQQVTTPKLPPTDEFAPYREFAAMALHDKPRITYKTPKVTEQETESHISYLVHVPGIEAATVSILEEANVARLQFRTAEGLWFEWSFSVANIAEWTHDIATTNMAVVCTKVGALKTPPFRISTSDDGTSISLLVDVPSVDPSSVETEFTSSRMTLRFRTLREAQSYCLTKDFDDTYLEPAKCSVASVADDNVLVVLSVCKAETPVQAAEAVAATMAPATKAALISRFTNDVMYELD
ncbi:hypothetical protein SPRG_11517 [Saprolegnia parasitica CBS 223.65]|uniref:Protein kintoun n=1 Tax=Saprolegnia parasitica (strain CBS 223.65) TaxID=695850 RepID=A0A067BY01_SAPPC|nr:hypothetical protein SPRG_11517 [Saprolegnia parasitica CBS 223.65]KDO23424.1 hypothetical protein SPRG_11517 [Saprolegnia parasitica CBS 223.65]|eukprot:XP_012205912.1 hypothetical protein SPRG_11517 [Saprolegnia parasitica CBS 223.65]